MKIHTEVGLTERQTIDQAYELAYAMVGVTELDKMLDNPREWHEVRQIVSKLMSSKISGRSKVYHKPKPVPNKEGIKIMRDRPIRTFPYKAKNKSQKLKYLTDLYLSDQIDFSMLEEFSKANSLRLSKKRTKALKIMDLI